MDKEKEILNNNDIIQDMRDRAKIKEKEILGNEKSTEKEKKYAKDVMIFLSNEENFSKVSKNVLFAVFSYLEYPYNKYKISFYNELYYKVMDQANKIYKLVDLDTPVRK